MTSVSAAPSSYASVMAPARASMFQMFFGTPALSAIFRQRSVNFRCFSLRHGSDPCCGSGLPSCFEHVGKPLVLQARFVYYAFMAKATKNVIRKRPGRPATGQDPVTAIRLSSELRTALDQWAARQPDKPSRSEAIRRLVELGLKVKPGKT